MPALLLLTSLPALAQWNLENGLNVRHAVFLNPESGPYVEVYINIHGRALRFEPTGDGTYRSSAGITVLLNEGSTVLDYVKYRLEGPEVRDTTDIDFSLNDLKRLNLSGRDVKLEVTVEDVAAPGRLSTYTRDLKDAFSILPAFSDIALVDSYKRTIRQSPYVRNGLEIMPYTLGFYPPDRNTLTFYTEFYGLEQESGGEEVLLTFSIRERGSENINPNFWQYQKSKPAVVLPLLREFDITDLPTGNYNLYVELRNRQNQILQEASLPFSRLNYRGVESLENMAMMDISNTWAQRYSAEQLSAFLGFLDARATPAEKNLLTSLKGSRDTSLQQRFLLNFWLQRDTVNPYKAWLAYLEDVKRVNDQYGTTSMLGYRTDRGRVYLQYGAPNDIISRVSEPGAAPYEIWQYYTLENGQTNIRFVFYEPSRVTNNYQLIHSNAIGELQDPRWKMRVYSNTANPSLLNNFDAQDPLNSYGTNASQFEDDAGGSIFNEGKP